MGRTRQLAALIGLTALALLSACARSEERAAERRAESERLYQAGYALMIERRYETARDTLEKAVRADKTNAEAWYDLSTVLMSLGKYAPAVRAARNAAAWYGDAALHDDKTAFRNDALVQAGEAYLWDGKHKQAAAQFQAVYDLDPADYNTLLNIVVTYIRCERVDDAVRFCEQNLAAQADPAALAPLHLLLANCQYAQGKEEAALRSLQSARTCAAQAATPAYDEPIAALHTLIVGDEAEEATPSDDADETAGQ